MSIFNMFGQGGSRSNFRSPIIPINRPPVNPTAMMWANALAPSHYVTTPLPENTGYVLLTNKRTPSKQYMGRNLEFDSNRGFLTRGKPERVILDGQVIWTGQIRNTSVAKLQSVFFNLYDLQQLTKTQVANIFSNTQNDPQMFGATAREDSRVEAMEAEYAKRFEADYQRRFRQEYPGKFSADFQRHYNKMVEPELDEVVNDHKRLYTEYIVTDKYIRYKR